jgi:hypothetical protein
MQKIKTVLSLTSLIILLCGMMQTIQAEEKLRTLTAQDGRTLNARIIRFDATRDEVTVMRTDRKPIAVQRSVFSEKDQAYILQWYTAELFNNSSKFKLKLSPECLREWKEEVEKKQDDSDNKKDKSPKINFNREYQYILQLENRCGVDLTNLSLEYCIFYSQEKAVASSTEDNDDENESTDQNSGSNGKDDDSEKVAVPEEQVKTGTASIQLIQNEDTTSVKSVAVAIYDQTGDKLDLKGEIIGAWFKVRMIGPSGALIERDVVHPSGLSKKHPWAGTTPSAQSTKAPEKAPTKGKGKGNKSP